MTVLFTPNIGLATPDENEVAKNWATNTQLADDNNVIIIDQSDINLLTYTPAIAAQTTAPSIGAGTIRGEYQDMLGFVTGSFAIEFLDPGVTVGSGEFAISLPFVVDNVFHSVGTAFNATPGPFSVVGEGYIMDSSVVAQSGHIALDVVTVSGTSYVRMLTEAHTTPVKTSRIVRDSMPFALATGDTFIGSFFYKKL